MKAILISIKPKWCAKIMNGDKTIEVRTSKALANTIQKLIDKYGYAEIYVYCSKNGGNLVYGTEYRGGSFVDEYGITRGYSKQKANEIFGLLNGKVIFKFRCYKVEEIKFIMDYTYGGYYNTNSYTNEKCFERDCCLTVKELDNYINKNNLNKRDNVAYALHISNLEIFDESKELSEFEKVGSYNNPTIKCKKKEQGRCNYGRSPFTGKWVGCEKARLTKAPQSFCYIEAEDLL